MLTANRFTTVVTRSTESRLQAAARNNPPIARREQNRGAVVAVQTALASLNNGYMAGAEIDGYFGRRTAAAVEAFQRDYGLIADGVVGRQVLTQLDQIYAGEAARSPMGVSLHIGVDRVDPAHYGSDLALPSCVNDAREMERIALGLGYDTARLENEMATTAQLIGFARNAAVNLFAGDAIFITFSGHGSQVPNNSADNEPDLQDETIVMYDRMLIDDEIYALLGEFREGVRVHLVFDSCHSGTAYKQLMLSPFDDDLVIKARDCHEKACAATLKDLPALLLDQEQAKEFAPIKVASLDAAIDGEAPETEAPAAADAELIQKTAELFADLLVTTSTGTPKLVPGDQFYATNKDLYDAVRNAVGMKELDPPACTVTSFSAAMDSQTTPAGNPLSLFTFNISQAWENGSFAGSYLDFHRAVLSRSRPDATPQLNAEGSMGASARLNERPFAF
ncbi:MAG: caspase family protein [Geminicoccaceae bacterium]